MLIKEILTEGLSDTLKRGIKSVKRGMQGWGGQDYKNMTDKETPRDLANRNKGYNDEKVKSLSKFRKAVDQERPAPAHSPQALQNRVLDREMKKRGLGEAKASPALHLMPTAGINMQKFNGQKHDFAAEVTALYGRPILKKEGNTTYYIKQNRVVAKYDNILDKGFVYSKNKPQA